MEISQLSIQPAHHFLLIFLLVFFLFFGSENSFCIVLKPADPKLKNCPFTSDHGVDSLLLDQASEFLVSEYPLQQFVPPLFSLRRVQRWLRVQQCHPVIIPEKGGGGRVIGPLRNSPPPTPLRPKICEIKMLKFAKYCFFT